MKILKVYVGNLSYSTESTDLEQLFSQYGKLVEVKIVKDFEGRSKGFGFVTFEAEGPMEEAIKATNGLNYQGRRLKVNVAKDNGGKGGGRDGGGSRDGGGRGDGGGYRQPRNNGNNNDWR